MALTAEDRQKGARAATVARQRNWAAERLKTEAVYRVVDEMADVAPEAMNAALALVAQAGAHADSVPVESTLDIVRLATAAEIVHRISRLASGQSTSNVAHASLTDDERRERMAQLRAMGTPAPSE